MGEFEHDGLGWDFQGMLGMVELVGRECNTASTSGYIHHTDIQHIAMAWDRWITGSLIVFPSTAEFDSQIRYYQHEIKTQQMARGPQYVRESWVKQEEWAESGRDYQDWLLKFYAWTCTKWDYLKR